MIDDMMMQAKGLLAGKVNVAACGVAIGGPLDARTGIIKGPPNLPGWDDVPLRSILESALGIPTRVEHDATACALAEVRWGGGSEARRLAYFTCGTGFGAGFVFDGDPYYGAAGHPADIGHIRLWDKGPVGYGQVGTIEAFCAASALGRIAAWKFPARWASPPTAEHVASLANSGDADATSVIDINASAVGRSCALVCDLLHTDMIVLGSLAQYLGSTWVDRVGESFGTFSHPAARRSCRIVESSLGPSVQDLGAIVAGVRALEGGS
jgi:glucokinase